jgi:phosphatidylglycerophosphate synthase
VIKARLGTDFDATVRRVFPFVTRLRVSPDVLTALGVLASLGAAVAFASGRPMSAGGLLLLGGFFDLIDGVVARAQGTSSSAGAFFDSSMDRVSDLLAFAGVACGMAALADVSGVALALWALGASLMTSYTRARAEQKLARFEIGLMERGERCAVLIAGAVLGFLELALWVIALGATWTTVQRMVHARRLLRQLDDTGCDPTASAGSAAAQGV